MIVDLNFFIFFIKKVIFLYLDIKKPENKYEIFIKRYY